MRKKEISEENISKTNTKKSKIKKILIFLFLIIIFLGIYTAILAFRWQSFALDMISNSPSSVLDTDENVIALIGDERNRKNISLEEMPDNLKNAYISIEDQRYYSHFGIDIKRTCAAILNYITKKSSSFGGSTITQQLVKNLTNDNSNTISRKIDEWFKAFFLEQVLSKDEILEAYLNIIYVGPNLYGVETGSKYYFNKSVNELSLSQCAFLAGINNSPNTYNPFGDKNNSEKIIKRATTVLNKMYELEHISKDDYESALSELEKGLNFKQGKIENNSSNIYSYHTDALLSDVINQLSERKHISKEFATNYLQMAGLKIYSTQNSKIQNILEKEFQKSKYIIKSSNNPDITSQAAMVIIDHSTGQVVGCVGGLGKKDSSRGFNRATQALRQTGSASKPIAVLAPAIANKLITASTLIVDEETTFEDGTEEGYSPIDYNSFLGEITVRRAVESSQNIPFVKIMEMVTPSKSINYMKKMGISTLTKVDDNINLALGGLDKGISPLEMAGAYATIANKGVYIKPTFYTKITNSNDNIILKSKQTKRKVMSDAVAYILTNLLTQPVTGQNGTATYCAISGIDVAAKTGTTNENYDRWLCGYTPYYTAVSWYGFDINETINYNHRNPAGLIWSSVMTTVHSNLEKKKFEVPKKGLESVTICSESGMYATDNCKKTYKEYFLTGTVPAVCTKHN